MQIHIDSSSPDTFAGAAVAVLCFETGNDPALAAQAGWLADIRGAGEFSGKLCEISLLYRPEGLAAKWLAVVGAGQREKFSAAEARKAAGALVRTLKGKGIRSLALLAPEPYSPGEVQAIVEGAILGDWEPSAYKSEPNGKQMEAFTLLVPGAKNLDALQNAGERGRLIADSQNLTRALVNEPPNKLNPAALVQAARQMAGEAGLECEVLDREAMAKLGMGALLGVAQGSINPPFFISHQYSPAAP
jgi:leucyl aminopeptidase